MRGSLGHLPSCLFGGGLCPCAGYSGFDFEPGSMLLIEPKPQWAHTPTSSQPFGRVDRRAAALSAVAICDAERIGGPQGLCAEKSVGGRSSERG